MLDGIWEIFQSTDRNGFLWWIAGGAVGLGDSWDNDLSVSHCSKGARLEKRLTVINTSSVHVQSCIH